MVYKRAAIIRDSAPGVIQMAGSHRILRSGSIPRTPVGEFCWGGQQKRQHHIDSSTRADKALAMESARQKYLADPLEWWNISSEKCSEMSPGMEHNTIKENLWIDGSLNPAWVVASRNQDGVPHDCGVRAACLPHLRVKGGDLNGDCVRVATNDCSFRTLEGFRKICEEGQLHKACQMVNLLDQQGIQMSSNIFYRLLQECINNKDLETGREVHSLIRRTGLESNSFLGSYLIRMFGLCGSLSEANLVFNKLPEPNVFTWSAIILAHAKHGLGEQAVELYRQMQQSGVKPDEHVFVAALKACSSLAALMEGKLIHDHVIESGLELDMCVGSSLIDMYAKCGSIMEAREVFDRLPKRALLPWNVMITGYAQHGCGQEALGLFNQMQQDGVVPNQVTFVYTLKACASMADLQEGKLIHGYLIDTGFESDIAVCNTLIDMYSKCGSLEDACRMFNKVPKRDLVTWNSIIAGHAQRHGQKALCLFAQMQQEGMEPSSVTFVNILKACSSDETLDQGKLIHSLVVESGFESDVIVGSSLMDMYAKCGNLKDAGRVFDRLKCRDTVTWNAMIAAYANHGHCQDAVQLFHKMLDESRKPDNATFVSVLKACSSMSTLDEGKAIHAHILKNGFKLDVVVGSTLIDMYAKFGDLEEARSVFDKLPKRDVVTWNAMHTAYVQHGYPREVLALFQNMQGEVTQPDTVTLVNVLKACSSVVALDHGKMIHVHLVDHGIELDDFVGNALVDMYSKCGNLEDARRVFDELPNRNLVAWSAMVAGHALRSDYKVALQYFEGMQREGLQPDDVTFVSLLSACSHKGLVQEGCRHFKSMIDDHGITPILEHYTCMADLLSRAGHLVDAENLLQSMPCESSVVGWMSLLSNCRTHSEVDIARRCFDRIVAIDCRYASAYVLMSNIYADARMKEDADKIEELRKHAQAWKTPGKAFVEVDTSVHEFIVGDRSHPRSNEIYLKLKTLGSQIHTGGGHVPSLHAVLQAMSDEEKEDALCGHCEKLAIAFGLIATPKGTVIRVSKNLRVCTDCHNATKIISKIEDREIIVRDSYRIHHFKDGVCSCNDYF